MNTSPEEYENVKDKKRRVPESRQIKNTIDPENIINNYEPRKIVYSF